MQDLLVEACELLVTTYEIQLSWGIEPGVLELGMQSLSHWTTKEVQMSVSSYAKPEATLGCMTKDN